MIRNAARVPYRTLTTALAFALALAPAADAATVCVTNIDELITALADAEDNGEDDSLLLTDGVYTTPIQGLAFASEEGKSLSIVGGYIPVGLTCAKFGPSPNRTIIDAPDLSHGLFLTDTSPSAANTPTYTLEDITFANGMAGWQFDNSGSAISHQVRVERVVHRNLTARSFFAKVRGTLRMWNNQVVLNGTAADPADTGGVIRLQGASSAATITHNTFSRNRFPTVTGNALRIFCDNGAATVDATNNIIRDNGTLVPDLNVDDACDLALTFNNYETLVGTADTSCCNTNLQPTFVDALAGDFRLRHDSPLRNIGDLTPDGGLPLEDFEGYPRPDGLLPDLGAHEFPWVFADGFETGNTTKWSAAVP